MRISRVEVDGLKTYGVVRDNKICTKELLEETINLELPTGMGEFLELLADRPEVKKRIHERSEWAIATGDSTSLDSVRLLPPTVERPKLICIGMNYRDHVEEQGLRVPSHPVIFMKPYTALAGPDQPIEYPSSVKELDYEAELAVIIGKPCKGIAAQEADKFIVGYTAFNDISARDIQFGDGQWTRGKSFDTFAPMGPWIVTGDEITDPNRLRIRSRVNGETRQDSNTSKMIFNVGEVVSFISGVMTLDPGDVISTGTPSGVGVFMRPSPKLLKVGDIVEVEIEKIGVIRNRVVRQEKDA